MASNYCWSCLTRLRPPRPTYLLPRVTISLPYVRRQSVVKKKTGNQQQASGPKYRESKNAVIKKKKKEYVRAVTQELKALRKRIVLSNTNALAVPGMQDLSTANMVDAQSEAKIIGLPTSLIDQLRALDAFKTTQNWGAFRRPATLIRKRNVELGQLNSKPSTERATSRMILTGERASGKSMMLLQAMAMALLKGWIVISIPDARDLTLATTAYSPLSDTNPVQYVQKRYTAKLLSQILNVNQAVLSTLSLPPIPDRFPVNLRQGTTNLAQLADIGAKNPEQSWDIFNLLWQGLTSTPSAPPILLSIDGISHLMTETQYRSSDFKPIHAHDLALVNHFVSHLSGSRPLGPSGGMVLAATSESNCPRVETFDLALKQLFARQARQSPPSAEDAQPEIKMPAPDPWRHNDSRVLQAMTGTPNGLVDEPEDKKSAPFRGVEVQQVAGLSKEETRSLVEYYAKSGLVRNVVDESFVGRTWTLAGGGNVGQIEKAVMGLRA